VLTCPLPSLSLPAAGKLLFSLPLLQCRIEKSQFQDGLEQKGCDFEFGIRVLAGAGFGRQERLLAVAAEVRIILLLSKVSRTLSPKPRTPKS